MNWEIPHDQVVTATHADEKQLAEMIADELADLPVARYLMPNESERREVLARTYRLDLKDVRERTGIVRTVARLDAVALWMYHRGDSEPERELDARLEKAVGDVAPRFVALYRVLDNRRREVLGNRPHWHLWTLAVRANQRRRNLDSLLIYDQLALIDKVGEPTYAEPATEHEREVCRRAGFVPVGDLIVLDDGRTRVRPMLHEVSYV